jgi:hypothetical protein
MRTSLGCLLLGMLLFGGCGAGGQEAQADEPDGPVQFTPVGDATAQGEVEVTRVSAGVTRVRVQLRETGTSGVHQGEIRRGTCDNPGATAAQLLTVATGANGNGSVTTTLQRSSTEFTDGNHVVVYGPAGGGVEPPIVCTRLHRRQVR